MESKAPRRAGRVLTRVVVAAALAGASVPGRAVCPSPGPAVVALPAQFLHSYRPFLDSPTRLAIDSLDRVHVADPLNGRVVVRAADGRVVEDLRGFDYPIAIAVDSSSRLYVGEGRAGRVDVYDAERARVRALGQGDGEFSLPGFLAVHEAAAGTRVFVSDGNADEVRAYDAESGVLVLTLGGTGSGDGQLIFPSGIDVSGDELFVVDRGNSRIQVFGVGGGWRRSIVPPADRCGFLCAFEGATRGRPRDAGLRVAADGSLLLAEASKGSVLVLAPDGVPIGSIGEFGSSPGRLRVPADIVLDSCGRVFVASAANARVDLFGLAGHSDPERFAPGRLDVLTDPLDPARDDAVVARVALPGQRLADVLDVRANGFAAPLAVTVGDADRDGVAELTLTFGPDLVAALAGAGSGRAEVVVRGRLPVLEFELADTVTVVSGDADGDGVDDGGDRCAGTAPGDAVDGEGCSVAQRCPCDGPLPGEPWRGHGRYQSCVARESTLLARAGVLSHAERAAVVAAAARSGCGRDARGGAR